MKDGAIRISGLVKSYAPGRWARRPGPAERVLDGVDLEVGAGEVLALLGANGAGKTTLVEILATHLLPTSGEVEVCGCSVVRHAARVRRLVGYAPASHDSFYPRLSARQNLEFFATLHGLSHAAIAGRVGELLALVDLAHAQHSSFQKLSLGMQQRLAIARALLADPPVLLLDEPTRSLDPVMQREMHRLLRDTLRDRQGKTILLVTHSFQEAETVSSRVAILSKGRITGCGSVAELLASTSTGGLADAFACLTGHDLEAADQRSGGDTGRTL